MIKLTYTEEMEYQDKLWNDEKENLETMERLQNQILNEYKKLTKSNMYFITYVVGNNEVITECYQNHDDMNDNEPIFHVGYCKALIEELALLEST